MIKYHYTAVLIGHTTVLTTRLFCMGS